MTEEQIKQNALDYGNCSKEWFDDISYVGESTGYDDAHAFYDGAHSRDEEIEELQNKIAELEEQHEMDVLYAEEANKLLKFHRAFITYLNDKAIGDKNCIIETVYGNDLNCFEGYVKVTKTIENEKIMLEFELERGGKYKAEWQPCDNYACWQSCGMMGDDYSGYLLFPTYKDDEYFACITNAN